MSNIIKPIIFVTGKGGVGKSLFAAATAYKLAKQGRRVLLVEFGSSSFYQSYLDLKSVQFKPQKIFSNLDIALWNTDECLRQYVTFYIKVEKLYNLFFENKIMREIISASPALKELAILGKLTSGIREVGPKLDYDHIVVDSYSTGHHKALLMAPKGISKVFRQGPMGYHSQKMVEVIQDPKLCSQIILFKAEDLPTTEALELNQFLKTEFGARPFLVCNQFLQIPTGVRGFYEKYQKQQVLNLGRVKDQQENILTIPFILDPLSGAELTETLYLDYMHEFN